VNILKDKLYKVKSRESFLDFLDLIIKDDKKNWENSNLNTYLDSVRNYTEDIDGYYSNLKNHNFSELYSDLILSYNGKDMEKELASISPEAWRIFADILFGARNYE